MIGARGAPPFVRRPEGMRWLRSDGKPNFSERVRAKEGDAKYLATRPVRTTTKTSTVLSALEDMSRYNVRALPVVHPSRNSLDGLVTVMDIANYLGGGELYNIIVKRHNGNVYSALLREYVASIMNPNPIYATVEEKLTDILEKMIRNNVGVLPVLYHDETLWGIVTEHDIVKHLVEKDVGVKVRDVMTSSVIHVDASAVLGDALRKMIKYGVRRLPILEDQHVWGIITAKDVVRFFGSHDVFRYISNDRFEEVLQIPVKVVGTVSYFTISPEDDVGKAATIMIEKGVSSLLVVENNHLKGIITERDILYALAVASP